MEKKKNKAAVMLGKRGGKKTKRILKTDPDYYKRIGRMGANKRWGNKIVRIIKKTTS